MGTGNMPGADEDPFAGDATEVMNDPNAQQYGNPLNVRQAGGQDQAPTDYGTYGWDTPDDFQQFFDWAHHGAPTGYPTMGPSWQQHYGQFSDPSQARWDSPAFNWGNEPTEVNQALAWEGGSRNRDNPLAGIPQHELRQPGGIDAVDQGQADWAKQGLDQLQDAYGTYRHHRVDDPVGAWNRDNPWSSLQNRWNQMGTSWDQSRQRAIDQKGIDDQAAAQQAKIDACVARNGTWNGVSCDEYQPPAGPTDQELCAQRGDGWYWDGSSCVQKPVVPDDLTTTTGQDTQRTTGITSPGTYDARVPDSERMVDTGTNPGDAGVVETSTYPGGLQQVGTDPLSRLQGANLATLMTTGGIAPTPLAANVEGALTDSVKHRGTGAEFETKVGQSAADEYMRLIESGGALPLDRQQRAMELENIRSPIDALREAQLAQGGAAMANRGLTGQGPEYDFRERVEEGLAPHYAQAGRDLELSQRQQENQRYEQALTGAQQMGTEQRRRGQEEYLTSLQTATGLTMAETQNLLSAIQTTGDLQSSMGNLALDVLDKNMQWSKTLSEIGINRKMVEEMVERGRLQDLAAMLNNYLDLTQISQRGFLPAK
tara:strand:- start:9161 stop:10951 length:1791 start_codon:yes stop_codon:yes gene_type:complete